MKSNPRRCGKCDAEVALSPGELGGDAWGRCTRCGAPSAPGLDGSIGDAPAREATTEGCVTCNSAEVRYMLVTDVPGRFTHMGFCSLPCLGRKLGFLLDPASGNEDPETSGPPESAR